MKNTAIRGRFNPANTSKYTGNVNKITYRSLWERRFMLYCDRSPSILEWSSEELHIPYSFEGKWRNYYPDFVIKYIDKNGVERNTVIEIKPHYQKRWKQNQAKWNQAKLYCRDHGYEFKVMTEKELF